MNGLLVVSIVLIAVGGLGVAWALPQLANGAAELLGHWWSAAGVIALVAGLTGLVLWTRNRAAVR
jgi:hypothetical protein